jgi:hypothetical protein
MEKMQMHKYAIWLGIAALGSVGAGVSWAAPGFLNLDFEQAQITNVPATMGTFIEPGPALPNWTPAEDGNSVSQFPTASLPQVTYIELVSDNTFEHTSASSTPIQGNFSVELSAYAGGTPGQSQSASISQTAAVPGGTQTINFLVRDPSGGVDASTPTVTLNGTPIAIVPLSNTAGIITYAGDVSLFAGTTPTLTFAALASGPIQNVYDLDSISFSTTPLPEPTAASLVFIASILLAARRDRSGKCGKITSL